ncbi:MAG: RNA-binding transcriptional accessory protein [Gammaproteobacteria bacterium]|nr:RNA-binding transcriptional accessory protein [Gammaproteobacteria bacterium]
MPATSPAPVTTTALPSIGERLAAELGAKPAQVAAAVALLDEGATVPFIARYRKEATGGLDDVQLRRLEERLGYLRELEKRRATILESVRSQGKLAPELEAGLRTAETKQRLEDLYAPYKPKRRSKAQVAIEAGLEALADALLADPQLDPEIEAAKYLRAAFETENGSNPGVPDTRAALDGARQILIERFAEDAELVGALRAHLEEHGIVVSAVAEGKEDAGAKFRDYFAYSEPYAKVAPHRALALFRGRNEDVLRVSIRLPEDVAAGDALVKPMNACERRIAAAKGIAEQGRRADAWLLQTARWTWTVKLAWQLEMELFAALRERAEAEAIRVFAANLHDLLLAAPAGHRVTMGLDPGLRTGVKVAIVDRTGKLLDTATVHPHVPRNDWDGALHTLGLLAKKHGVELISIGNGTASRETDRLAAELVKRHPELRLVKIVVSEAGASVYSASELASREFPQLDVSLRGAVSIARRLQDPLAELVKIDPKSIGVGQYQHDVSQVKLAKQLDAVVEDCVNAVGVDVNTASVPLLARISGLTGSLAENIVMHRDAHGPFRRREQLKDVPRLGPKTFEQAAGFLRIPAGDDPLDASAVHPEAYPVVERILGDLRRPLGEIMRDGATLKRIDPARYTDERFGLPTVRDILRELEKPGRDPRPEFRTATFREGVEELAQLEPSMILEGVVTNVTAFGAFVDVGVHQDGLVHISVLSNRFVRDPREVVKAGDIVKVKVLEVDVKRRRIALSMRLDEPAGPRETRAAGGERGRDAPGGAGHGNARQGNAGRGVPGRDARRGAGQGDAPRRDEPRGDGVMADALKRALQRH